MCVCLLYLMVTKLGYLSILKNSPVEPPLKYAPVARYVDQHITSFWRHVHSLPRYILGLKVQYQFTVYMHTYYIYSQKAWVIYGRFMGGKHRFYFFPSRIVLLTITSSIKLNLKNELILFSFHRISGMLTNCQNKL